MGEIHKKSLEGFKVDPSFAKYIVIVSIFFGAWATLIAAFLCKDENKRGDILKCFLCQFLTSVICIGWCWAIKWAMEAKAQSA
jgi:hypothetical protein